MNRFLIAGLMTALLAACGQSTNDEAAQAMDEASPQSMPSATEVNVYEAAAAHPDRPPEDLQRDAGRKGAQVLEFLGIGPGDRVLELFAGGGYYTELLSRVVGDQGHVVAHVNTPMVNFGGDEYANRHSGNRLPNVEVLLAENNALELGENEFDAATIVLNYHDLYWSSEQYGWDKIDVGPFLDEIRDALKPGGTLGVVDHVAAAGSPPDSGNTLHRIDPAYVIMELEGAGFVLDSESDLLRNPDDDHTLGVFDPSIRGNTDRFVLRFIKPE